MEPWVADPVTGTARMLGDVNPGAASSNPWGFVALGADIVFVADSAATGIELFKQQPSASAPVLVADAMPGPTGSVVSPWPLVVSGSKVFFVASVPATGQELWRSDGTAAGTAIVRDVNPGTGAGCLGGRVTPVCASGLVLFQGTEPGRGSEMWLTDGTPGGTRLLFDLVPGAGSGLQGNQVSDGWATLLGTTWFFLGTTPATGTEPFAFEASWLQAPCTTCPVAGCAGTSGVPRLEAVGQPTLGNGAFALRVRSARPASLGLLLLDAPGPTTALPGGCTLFTGALPLIFAALTDGAGEATSPLPIPIFPWLLGAALRTQWAVLDPNGAFQQSLSFSNGCHVVLGI
jgi:ELWxxDGT repeat protein